MFKKIFIISSILLVALFTQQCRQKEIEKIIAEKSLIWEFPLKRTHSGILLGNGVQGLMVWGYDNQLNLTIGRAGFWDHRGGNDFASRTNFEEVKRLLYANDEQELRKAFETPDRDPEHPPRPQQIGGGRIEIILPDSYTITKGTLILDNGTILIELKDSANKASTLRIRQSVFSELAWIDFPENLVDSVKTGIIPTWDYVHETLSAYGVQAPERWQNENSAGFIQSLPEDDPLAIVYRKNDKRLILASHLGPQAGKEANRKLENFEHTAILNESNTWWEDYWSDIPVIDLPDPLLQEIVDYGHYKQACATPPHGIACSLQGPFNEEYQLPPWSNDYHFNINIEMIYWPALASNRLDHLDPVWDMILSWMPELRSNGEKFFGREGAIMLPHAVDDRCKVVGTFWTGTIDHACTAWMAQLAWLHYRYGMDKEILETVAWPLLVGAFEGYWAMLEETKENGEIRYTLPVSVSPEFKGSRMDAWGRDASFQLAALHMISDILPKAAAILGKEEDSRWQKVSNNLPAYTLIEGPVTLEWPENKVERIALWEGMDLIESHRHHSYLGGIWPFMSYDPLDGSHKGIVENTLDNWVLKGPGLWSGWCVPWASIINSRTGRIRASIEWLHWWNRNFTNEGRGTLHNAAFRGTSLISSPDYSRYPVGKEHNEIMQLDAGFGALTAVYELLIQDRNGVIHVLPEIPFQWKDLSFENILTEGAFLFSAEIRDGKRTQIEIVSQHDGKVKVAHGLGESCLVNGEETSGEIITIDTMAGQSYVISPE